MEEFDISKLHSTFTDESNSVIAITDLIENIKNESDEEKINIIKQIMLYSREQNKLYEKEIKYMESFYKNRETSNNQVRKVVNVKKIKVEDKKVINNIIKEHFNSIKEIINMSLSDLQDSRDLLDKENINYYLLGLIKEITDYQKMADDAYLNHDKSLLKEIKEYINSLEEKISYLKFLANAKEDNEKNIKKCRILFLETSSHRSYFLEDIAGLEEFYNSFQKLFLSLELGKPIKVKCFNNNNKLNGLTETRDPYGQTRIFYDKINEDTYIILNAIVKKEDNSLGYKNKLENRYNYYLQNKDIIIKSLDNEEYLSLQEEYLQDAKEKLGLADEINKKIKKG